MIRKNDLNKDSTGFQIERNFPFSSSICSLSFEAINVISHFIRALGNKDNF